MLQHNLKQMAALQRQVTSPERSATHNPWNGNNYLNVFFSLKENKRMISADPFAAVLF